MPVKTKMKNSKVVTLPNPAFNNKTAPNITSAANIGNIAIFSSFQKESFIIFII